ncbi:purine phosphoribosyltransferase family protein [Flindersiella endophytica]
MSQALDREQVVDLLRSLVRDVPDYPKPGILFKDITPVLADPAAFEATVRVMAEPWRDAGITKVVGVEARGFILAAPLALDLRAGFVPVRKQGKLPAETYSRSYALEYGEATLEMHKDALEPGERVLIIDDVLATGGTVAATAELVESCGAEVAGVSLLMELTFLPGRERLPGRNLQILLSV